jgi:hypothetical protein
MTQQELIAYFANKELPETLRIDRATTQFKVEAAVKRNIDTMLSNPKETGAKHRLTQIMNALETPYDGPGIPRM